MKELSNFQLSLEEWTKKAEQMFTKEIGLGIKVDLALKKGTYNKYHKTKMCDLFEKKADWNFPITTIHKVKGMTLDTILLFLHKNKRSISLADIEFKANELTELQSMIYVAMSRPRHLLTLAIEDCVSKEQIESVFGTEIEITEIKSST